MRSRTAATRRTEAFINDNPLLPTPNPVLNEALASLRWAFSLEWSGNAGGAMVHCAAALARCSEKQRPGVFAKYWNGWCKSTMDQIQTYYEIVNNVGQENVDCARPDPAGWAFDCLYRLVAERMAHLPDSREHVVDGWVKPLCRLKQPGDPVPEWIDVYNVVCLSPHARGTDLILPELRRRFEELTSTTLLSLRMDSYVRLALRGWRNSPDSQPESLRETATYSTPSIGLRDLEKMDRNDPKLRRGIYAIYPKLREEISLARHAVRREQLTVGLVRDRFRLLGDAGEKEIQDVVFKDPKATTAAAAAKGIICHHADLCEGTVDRYTRK
jgi:hypothetical protein